MRLCNINQIRSVWHLPKEQRHGELFTLKLCCDFFYMSSSAKCISTPIPVSISVLFHLCHLHEFSQIESAVMTAPVDIFSLVSAEHMPEDLLQRSVDNMGFIH